MSNGQSFGSLVFAVFFVSALCACGAAEPPPQAPEEEEEFDLVSSVVGDVEVEKQETEQAGEDYKGPTALTVNLKIVDKKNPEGSFKLLDAEGKTVIENGKFGEPHELNQGTYSIEFSSPLIVGNPTYLVENVDVSGKEAVRNEVFPAGQINLFAFYPKKPDKCVPVTFDVRDISDSGNERFSGQSGSDKRGNPAGKGKTCEPIILRAGSYELELNISKKQVQPVKLMVNSEQISDARVELVK